MKDKITDEIRSMLSDGKEWLELELHYVKLTAAEKITILMSTLIFGAVCLFMAMVVIVLFSFALAQVFCNFLSPGLAYLSVGGIVVLLMVLLALLRKPLIFNPIAKFLTRLIIDKEK